MNSQDDMSEMFDNVPGLTTLQRETAKARYRFLLNEYSWRSWQYAILFYVFRITMTVGSLTVPALLSLKVDGPAGETALYWTTWAISLAVTTSNGLMTLFKLDRRFFMLHGVAERLRTETWQYLTLAGRYSGHYNSEEAPTHVNQYVYYCTNIEKIRMRHMDDEYISVGEAENKNKSVQGAATAAAAAPATVTSQPPAQQQTVPPVMPPPGTQVPFLSPTRRSDVPTPPNPASRRPSYSRMSSFTRPPQQQPQPPVRENEDAKEPVGTAAATVSLPAEERHAL
jgi:hypothetical protein